MSMWPVVMAEQLTWIDAAMMAEIDRLTIQYARVSLFQMMENAGRSLAEVVSKEFAPKRVVVLAGSGGNGGGGLVAARHLCNAGVEVLVVLSSRPDQMAEVPTHQLAAVNWLSISVSDGSLAPESLQAADLVIDAMVGYSLNGALRGTPLTLAEQVNVSSTKVVSLDVPSGLTSNVAPHRAAQEGSTQGDASNDNSEGLVVQADATLTLCLPKEGMRGRNEVGQLFLADISVPAQVVTMATGHRSPPFDRGPILRVID